jgi:hypothetical protein
LALLEEVLEAHGGRKRWGKVKTVRAHVHGEGMLMRLKGMVRQFREFDVEVETAAQRLVIDPYPYEGQRGIFDAGDVRIEGPDGEVLSGRKDARDAFFGATGMARQLRWSHRDALYFMGYAMWNYLNAPFCFEWPGVEVREGEPVQDEEGRELRCLEVTYPEGFHTHCIDQLYYFDSDGLLRRHDYHPEVVLSFAHVCHLSSEPERSGGILFETERRMVPKGTNGPLAHPTTLALDLSAIELS